MRVPRIYTPQHLQPFSQFTLDADASRHIAQVLRLKSDAPLVLFDGSGRDFEAHLEQASARECIVRTQDILREEAPAHLVIKLAIGISRGERMDFSLQKAVELGVAEIRPLFTSRCMVQLKGERLNKRLQHWQGVIQHACEQSGRSRLPTLHPARPLNGWLEGFAGTGSSTGPITGASTGLMLDHRAELPLVDMPHPGKEVTLLVGPEGGLSPQEREQASRHGFQGARMGPRVLRTETAPLAALAVIQALWGDFRGGDFREG